MIFDRDTPKVPHEIQDRSAARCQSETIRCPPIVHKAFIFLTQCSGSELLVLAHPEHPEAGLQVPAGTVEARERTAAAARRELVEETDLRAFDLISLLGERMVDMRPFGKEQLHHRYFFHATLTAPAPDRWRHAERHAGLPSIPLELFWCKLGDGPPELIAGHGDLLMALPSRSQG